MHRADHHEAHGRNLHGQKIVQAHMFDQAAFAGTQRGFERLGERIGADCVGFDEALFAAADLGDEDHSAPVQALLVHALEKIEPHQSSLST